MFVSRLRRFVGATLTLIAALAAASVTASAAAQMLSDFPAPWPCKVVRLVVPYPPGGSSDVLARLLAPKLMQRFATTIVVENKSGFNGTVGTAQVAGANADGCMWLLGNATPIVVSRNFYPVSPEPYRMLAAVAEIAAVPLVFYVNTRVLPVSDMNGLVAALRANPDRYAHASPGSGTPHHLIAEQFKREHGLSAVHVPYRGSGPAIADVLAGHVAFSVEAMSAISPHLVTPNPASNPVASNPLRALATTGEERSSSLPDVPTMAELGYANFVVTNWYGLFVPKGTPADLIEPLNAAIRDIVALPDVARALAQLGAFNGGYSASQYQEFVDAQVPYWAGFVKQTGVTID